MPLQSSLNHFGNPAERDSPGQKRAHRHLVRGVERRRRGAAGPARLDPGVEGPEHVAAHRLEGKGADLDRVERPDALVRRARRVGQRVENRQLHRGEAELGQHAAVGELDEGVDDALGVHHHVHPVVGQAEEMVRLDHLHRLVGQRRAIDGDLVAHAPGGMVERFRHGRGGDPLGAPPPEGAAAGGQDQALE